MLLMEIILITTKGSVHLGMEDSRASPKLEDSPSPWGHLAPLTTWLSCSGCHLWRQILEVASL